MRMLCRLQFLRGIAAAIMTLEFTAEIASAFCPADAVVVTTITPKYGVSNSPMNWQRNPTAVHTATPVRRSNQNSLHVLQSAKIIPCAFRSLGVALACKAYKLQLQKRTTDAAVVLATALMSYCNFATLDNERLKSAKRAVKRFDKHSEKELKEDAEIVSFAKKWKAAVRIKLIGEFLSLAYMTVAKNSRNLYLGAAAVVGSTIVFLLMGGGRFQHNASGRLDPIAEDFLSKAYLQDISVAVAAVSASILEPSVGRQICAGYVAFGYFVASLQGLAPKKLNKAVWKD